VKIGMETGHEHITNCCMLKITKHEYEAKLLAYAL